MSNKKSYMSSNNIILEGFFDNIINILKTKPELNDNPKIKSGISSLNKTISDFEKKLNRDLKNIDPNAEPIKIKRRDFDYFMKKAR